MQLLTQNSKIKKSHPKLWNFGIPAFKSKTGFKTCPNAAACVVGCYATMGAYRFSNVARAFEARLKITKGHWFRMHIQTELDKKKPEYIRIHDSGDFYSEYYLNEWVRLAKYNTAITFYAYTKMVSMLKSTPTPSNLIIIYSQGGTEDKLINTKRDRHSRVFESTQDLIQAGYADASKNDLIAIGECKKIGLVYHGNKNYSNTNWSKVIQSKQGSIPWVTHIIGLFINRKASKQAQLNQNIRKQLKTVKK